MRPRSFPSAGTTARFARGIWLGLRKNCTKPRSSGTKPAGGIMWSATRKSDAPAAAVGPSAALCCCLASGSTRSAPAVNAISLNANWSKTPLPVRRRKKANARKPASPRKSSGCCAGHFMKKKRTCDKESVSSAQRLAAVQERILGWTAHLPGGSPEIAG